MQIGLVTDSLGKLNFTEMLDWCAASGIEAVELGTGNFSSAPHCSLSALLDSEAERRSLLDALAARNLTLSALNCSGNILDGDEGRRTRSQRIFFDTLKLAQLLGVRTVVAMSGCPGESIGGVQFPNWVTSTWQPEYQALLAWQWDSVIVPFWRTAAEAAAAAGVRIAIEMHPGQAVYNPYTLRQLTDVTGDVVGANLDPSHLFWQGIDPLRVIGALGPSIYHVHAKDCWIDPEQLALNGVIDNRLGATRTWEHCSPGVGHGEHFWRAFVAALAEQGYRGSLSIEYAGPRADAAEGTRRTVRLLRRVMG